MRLGQWCAVIGLLVSSSLVWAESGAEAFVNRVAPGATAHMLWLTPELRSASERILGHAPAGMRVRYWQQEARTVWIMDELGKEQPITFGVAVRDGKVEHIEVLEYRESRGGEIRQGFFSRQYLGARLANDGALDRHIDGITGATLSVGAMTRVARLALYWHQQVVKP